MQSATKKNNRSIKNTKINNLYFDSVLNETLISAANHIHVDI